MKLYGAIDLHSTNSVVSLIDEQDRVVYQKRLDNNLTVILHQLSPYRSSLEGIAVESTYNWYWLVDGLMEADYRVHLANTAAVQQYEGLKYTDDHSDARWLAHLLRLGILQRKKAKTNGIVAIKAVAHKLARACYYIIQDEVPFDVAKAFAD